MIVLLVPIVTADYQVANAPTLSGIQHFIYELYVACIWWIVLFAGAAGGIGQPLSMLLKMYVAALSQNKLCLRTVFALLFSFHKHASCYEKNREGCELPLIGFDSSSGELRLNKNR